MFGFCKKRRRRKIRQRKFPAEWINVLESNLGVYGQLPAADQRELQEHILVFLNEKRFEGCGGLEMNDEAMVTGMASEPDGEPGPAELAQIRVEQHVVEVNGVEVQAYPVPAELADANAAIQTTASAVDTLNGTGTQTAFTLSENAPSGVTDVLVFVNGSLQTPTTHYTLSGTTITFTTAPSSGTNNVIVWGTSTVVEAAKTAAQSARDTALGYQNTTDDYRQTVISYATRVNDYAQTFSADVGTNTIDFSAKEHAVGVANAGALSTGGSAKDWAVYESGTVRGGGSLYSAKVYAADISLGTDTSGGSARGWTQTAEDTDVPGASSGSRSALHYAAKAAASYDSFDDRYLGAKSSDPTVDNDGDALLDGTLYFNTTAKNMRAYDLGTTTWNVLDALPQGLGTTDTPTFATPTSAGHAATKE